MIGEFESYHGAAIRQIIVGVKVSLEIEACDFGGRVNAYIVNENLGIHLKHSSKRLPPWQFTYPDVSMVEIERLANRCSDVCLILVCGSDGVLTLSLSEFWAINPQSTATTRFVRVDRDRNKMYRVNGTGGKLSRPKRRGLHYIFEVLQDLK